MTDKPSVLVAMSGGVDSSVAAAMLQRAGYDVTGVFMCLRLPNARARQGCCSPEDSADARRVADQLGIKFYVLDFQTQLEQIIDYFVDEYSRGRTPNPCVLCNSRLKFGKLMDYADLIGAQFVATGHYARIVDQQGCKRLCRGADEAKDQSYALFEVGRTKLDRMLLPAGDHTKDQIRALAAQMKLPVHDKPESQEICFVPDDDYASLVAARAPQVCQAGQVLDTQGNLLGEHQGIHQYTIGQRRGLGIAMGRPMYVVRLDPDKNQVVLGTRRQLAQRRLWADRVTWLADPMPRLPFAATVQIRYNHRGAAATVTPLPEDQGNRRVLIDFAEPIDAITPGQAAVFYDANDAIVGGGWIERAGE